MTTMIAMDRASVPSLAEAFDAEPLFRAAGLFMALLMVPTLGAMALDGRVIEGVNVWVKPFKFQLSLALYLLSLAVFARWLPVGFTQGRRYRVFAAMVVLAVALEVSWIMGASAFGVRSHFNTDGVMGLIYPLMGALAVLLTSATIVYGVVILRMREARADPLALSIGLGLVVTFPLTVVIAGYLAQGPTHFVGTPSDPQAVSWLMGWSREVGDIRVAHFLGTHAMHVIPLGGLAIAAALPRKIGRMAVLGLAALYVGLTLVIFAQALAGRPFLPGIL